MRSTEANMQMSNCDLCKHLSFKEGIGACCPAFPEGIDKDRRLHLLDLELEGKECNNGVKFEIPPEKETK